MAVSLGLILVHLIQPGTTIPEQVKVELSQQYNLSATKAIELREKVKNQSPLQPLVSMVPENIVAAAGNNQFMLQLVFFSLVFGMALLEVKSKDSKRVISFFNGLNEGMIKLVSYIMKFAPIGVFALMASLIVELAQQQTDSAFQILISLCWYVFCVILGLAMMVGMVYPLLLRCFTKLSYTHFIKAIRPALLLAFSTSSSSATLPLTLKLAKEKLCVSPEVRNFVLPLGATINMDGTSLYQGVATVFIAQVMGIDLSMQAQLMIILIATLSSIGSAGVPGSGIVMLVVVLETVGLPATALAMILAPDRIIDMCRTLTNVTGDATVMMAVEASESL